VERSDRAQRALLPFVVAMLLVGAVATAFGASTAAELSWGVAVVVVAVDLVVITVSRLRQGRVAVDVVALLALLGALALGELLAGAIIALMVASGGALEQHAHRRARRELSALLSLAPTMAHRRTDGGYEHVPVEAVAVGDRLLVRPGEVVPVDGTALDQAVLDESVLTGESRQVDRRPGELVRSGSVNAGGAFSMRTDATAADSAYAGIVELVRSAGVERAPFVRLADRYALVFIPVVLFAAAAAWLWSGQVERALAVLVVATPCPLVLAAPVAIVSGISGAARHGVVVKDGGALEAMAGARTVLFDKTGTLTSGHARLIAVLTAPGIDPGTVLAMAASLEQASPHVLASALVSEAVSRGLTLSEPSAVREQPGSGATGIVDGSTVTVGSVPMVVSGSAPEWFETALRRARREGCSTVAVAIDTVPAGLALLADELRTDTPRALRALRRAGVDRIAMLSGDRLEVAEPIGRSVGVDEVFADRSPAEKVEVVRLEATQRPGTTVMVGDGVNDAPALAAADLGVAMGARGATASSEAADAVLVVDRLDRLADGITVAKRARAIARQSVLLGMGLSFAGMAAAAVGLLPPLAGAITQELIDVAAIANALRALRRPGGSSRPASVPDTWAHGLAGGHGPLRLLLDDLRATAATLDDLTGADALRTLRDTSERIRTELLPHERLDENEVYPGVSATIAGDDPLASMSRTHQEIFHLAALLDRLVTDPAVDDLDAADRSEARRVLYALDAIIRLHFAQEEELLTSLTAEMGVRA
jgi:heavy metal translocating P-type ATPase